MDRSGSGGRSGPPLRHRPTIGKRPVCPRISHEFFQAVAPFGKDSGDSGALSILLINNDLGALDIGLAAEQTRVASCCRTIVLPGDDAIRFEKAGHLKARWPLSFLGLIQIALWNHGKQFRTRMPCGAFKYCAVIDAVTVTICPETRVLNPGHL